ncbi:polyhedron envelope protein 2 [Diatraea saccharalis granulovirus]|uniref:Polyhedron envelope protein 2 n=1 Tax=Diatraea saccharalis granulovirus TaxID=1675862 RepID=A0A0R7EYY6_9BBAC|nr:polyhedron envelope protein 2 [Diatraea saccharalis granulovirus]AKN80707.1 polyhedron envelope protein 2 [Diatraea saccharalis granulovirus]
MYSCLFTKSFDCVEVPLVFVDMVLWVGADEALRILKLSPHTLSSLPNSEKTTLKQLEPCAENNNKCFITALGVGLLTNRLINRGCLTNDNNITNDNYLPERANAFANIFLTDIISEIRILQILCGINKTEDEILTLLNEPITVQ